MLTDQRFVSGTPATASDTDSPHIPPHVPLHVPLQVSSTALGDFETDASAEMRFLEPLFGFASHTSFVIVPAVRTGLWWLQSLHDPDITFLLGDPFLVFPSYSFDIGDGERDRLGIQDASDVFGLVMLTLPSHHGEAATANCRAPLVFNLAENVALQVLSRDERHQLREPIDLSRYQPQAVGLRIA